MDDKLRSVRINVLGKDSNISPINILTSADSVLVSDEDGAPNIKEYIDNKMMNISEGINNTDISNIKENLTSLDEKVNNLPNIINTNISNNNGVSELGEKLNGIAITKDEANYLRTKMDESLTSIARLDEQLKSLPVSKEGALELALNGLKDIVNDLKVKISELKVQDKITMTTSEAEALRERVDKAITSSTELKTIVDRLLTTELNTLSSDMVSIRNKLSTIPETVLSADGFTTTEKFDKAKAELEKSIEDIKTKINQLPKTSVGGGDTGALFTEISSIKSTISDLQSKVALLKLQDNIAISKEEAQALRTKVDELLIKVSKLESSGTSSSSGGTTSSIDPEQLKTINQSISILQSKIQAVEDGTAAGISGEFNTLKEKFKIVQDEVAALKIPSTIAMTKEEGNALRSKVDQAIIKQSEIDKTVKDLPDKLNNSTSSEIGALKQRLTAAETTIENIPSNTAQNIANVNTKLEELKKNLDIIEAKLPTSFAVTKDEVNFIRNRTEEMITSIARLEANAKIVPDYANIIKKDETIVDIKNRMTDAIDKINSVKTAYDKTYPITPIVVDGPHDLISFRKSISITDHITKSTPKEMIIELPDYKEFIDVNMTCNFKLEGFNQWEYRIITVTVDNNTVDDPDTGRKSEMLCKWQWNTSGGERVIPMFQGFRILKGLKIIRILIEINDDSIEILSPYNLKDNVFTLYGIGM